MSEPLDVAQWARNWEAMARQAQSALAAKGPESSWDPTGAGKAWTDALAKANPFAGGAQQSEAMERLLSGAQGYLGMLQSLAGAVSGQAGATEGIADALRSGFFPGAFSAPGSQNPVTAALRGFSGQGARGFEQMMDQFAAAAGPMFDKARGALHQPAFGFLREKQEDLQKTAQVFIDYQEQSARYDRLMLKVSEQSFARFQLKLAEREEPGRQIESVRALYDLWIDAAEEAYAEIALSEEFREVYGAVVDAQMRVRRQVQGDIEKLCGELGMPTRSEVDSIGQRLQALRREFRGEREAVGGHADLKAEVESLRSEVKGLKSALARQGRPAANRTTEPVSAESAGDVASPAASAKPKAAKASKPARSGKTRKSGKLKKARKAEKASIAAKTEIEAKPEQTKAGKSAKTKPAKTKSRRKTVGKSAPKRRGKRARSSAASSASGESATRKSSASGAGGKPKGNSFAASIARFARKSRSSAASDPKRAAKSAASRGGSQ